ncbi:MAG: hypothetical protein COB36_02775 [Alphaproteobacteria bacterium]|nr:MAG: hypothetical protein COB36_02775 [Alphaproteobacteria bacterium]
MRFAIILCCLFVMSIPAASAQSESGRANSLASKKPSSARLNRLQRSLAQYTGYYDEAVEKIYKGSTQFDFDVSRMRGYYARSDYYMPFSKKLLDEMAEYAYIVDTSDNKEEVNEALVSYKYLVQSHLAHLDALTFALSMSRLDERFGNEILLSKVRRALLKAILFEDAKCEEPNVACSIVSYGEETYILGKVGGTLKGSKIYHISNKYYNVHNLIKDGQEIQVYIDVSLPIVNVLNLQAVAERGDDITVHPQ